MPGAVQVGYQLPFVINTLKSKQQLRICRKWCNWPNAYDHGKAYTEKEYQEMLTNAGFTDIAVEYDALVDGMDIVSAIKQ